MMLRFNAFLHPLFLILSCLSAAAQDRPVGFWRAHLPANSAQGIATDGLKNYVITGKGFFTFVTNTGAIESFSKVEGLHDTNPVAVGFDRSTETCIIGYDNSNIDLFRHNNFKALPDLKNKSFTGSKSIRHIYTDSGFAYLSTGLGIVVIDLDRQEVKSTYVFSKGGQTISINAFGADKQYFYAASDAGVYRISRNATAPQVFANWQAVDTQSAYTHLVVFKDTAYASSSGRTDTLFRVAVGSARKRVFYSDTANITSLDAGPDVLYTGVFNRFTGQGRSYHLGGPLLSVQDSTFVAYPKGTLVTDEGRLWVADAYQGMGAREANGRLSYFVPNGPNDADNTDLYARGGDVWVAHGGINPRFYSDLKKTSGLSHFKGNEWEIFSAYNYPLFKDTVFDFIVLTKDERTGTLYAGSFQSGIYERKADGSARIIKQGELLGDKDYYPAHGIAVDQNNRLWVNQYGLNSEIAMRDADGSWYHYAQPKLNRYFANTGAKMLVDDYNQKWFIAPRGGGVMVFNDEEISNPRNLSVGKGQGNLPSATVFSIVKDRDGAIWIGTDKGIAIVSSPSQMLADRSSDAEQRVVQYDQFAGYLFSNESVAAMAVDGANRKWVGTSNGVWLLSPDASKIISRFTVDNSPLPSNTIQSIAVDNVTGDVYIGTPDGLVSYRGTATEGAETASDIKTFPSPIPSGYTGPITLNGFTTDADVRITDIAGQLIYRAKSAGGQLVWNGMDYTGHRPQSGVLLVFATNKDGTQAAVGKMMFLH